jgi:hypothetical protein
VRVALISLAGEWPAIAGKPLAGRQAAFALAAGAERIVAVGDGAGAPAIALRHAVERAGASFQAIRDCRGLLGAVRSDDELLVLAPGLLPEAAPAIDLLRRAPAILVLPANTGAAAGFERIDLQRAWAGALVLPGALVDKLAGLPAETEPAAALLRVALQAGAREIALDEALLADGTWTMLREDADGEMLSHDWLRRHVPPASGFSLGDRLASAVVRGAGLALLRTRRAAVAAQAGAWAALMVGAVLAWFSHAAIGLALVALAVVAQALAKSLRWLEGAPVRPGRRAMPAALDGWLADAALIAASASAIDGSWPHRLFPPLVLVGALRAGRLGDATSPAALLADRALVAALLSPAALVGQGEPAIMLLALLAIGLNLPKIGPSNG